jgi:hypothetical protein
MAEYINIKGQNIEVVASDPANPTLGQIWYNSTSNTLKGGGFQVSAWATGAGNAPSGDPSATEEYDGTSWSGGGTFPSTGAIFNGSGAGTLTAGLAAGLSPSTSSAEYDGTNWTAGGSLTTGRTTGGAAGTQTASFLTGGNVPPSSAATEEYDGTSWTAGGTRNQPSTNLIAFGTQTAGVATVGEGFSPPTTTETYDGTSWTTSTSFNSARTAAASAEEYTGASPVTQTITAS